MTDARTPAGWYPDGSGNLRYWDGNAWTEHTAPGPGSAQPPATAAEASASPADAASIGDTGPTQPYYAAAGMPVATLEQPSAAPSTKPHVLGIIALVVAAIGFIFACIPGALIVGWILLPVAFILSIVAFFLKGAKWPAITALVVSVVGTIVGVVVFLTVVTTSFSEAFEDIDGAIAEASEAAEEAAVPDDTLDDPVPDAVGNLAFGDTMTWEDGVSLTVSAPEGYSPTETALGADQANNLLFTITITNNSSANLEPLAYSQLSSGGLEGSQIFDTGSPVGDVGASPSTVILPGQSVSWKEAWSVADPASLTMQIAPSWDYEDAIFTNLE
ncbi:DUF2510 domain-containing protein [Agromyces mariniharenae]|uniref:DUF2510 domain-containing protein n=1 Tax=Agromyces mariniharenae TaxID=2604423 RepID=UPI001EE58F0F|nr:DUF2510 domain-containing protein [Agromyces mariniharenae]